MATVKTSEVRGFKEIEALLKKLPEKTAEKVVNAALRSAANVIKKAAQDKAPVRTGALKKSLAVELDKSTKTGTTARIGAKRKIAWYAHIVEFGSSHSAARPFLRPAFDETQGKVMQKLAKQLLSGIFREAEKLRVK